MADEAKPGEVAGCLAIGGCVTLAVVAAVTIFVIFCVGVVCIVKACF